jgi:hypothetical protein
MTFLNLTMRTTALVTTTLIITLGIYDLVVVVISPDTSLSVSQFLVNVGFNRPAFVFATGFVCGHLFGYMKPLSHYTANLKSSDKIDTSKNT